MKNKPVLTLNREQTSTLFTTALCVDTCLTAEVFQAAGRRDNKQSSMESEHNVCSVNMRMSADNHKQ